MTNDELEQIGKDCGAIIHKDGNIFLTNVEKLRMICDFYCAKEIDWLHGKNEKSMDCPNIT